MDLQALGKEHFEEHLHTHFKMHVDENTFMDLELIKAEERSNEHIDSFSLIFKGSAEQDFPQGTYQLEHATMGTLHLFLVPIQKDHTGLYYQAVFSRLKKS